MESPTSRCLALTPPADAKPAVFKGLRRVPGLAALLERTAFPKGVPPFIADLARLEWAVHEVGAERVLFGTDTPLYSTAMQRARIDHADLTETDKRLILRDNALNLFGSKLGDVK